MDNNKSSVSGTREEYKRYLREDHIPVPRSTKKRWLQQLDAPKRPITKGKIKSDQAQSSCQRLMAEILQDEPQGMDEKDVIIENLKRKIEELKREKREQRMENKNLRRTIRLMTNLPDMLAQMKMLQSAQAASDVNENIMVQEQLPGEKSDLYQQKRNIYHLDQEQKSASSRPDTIADKIEAVIHRCNNRGASKLVNDLMTALFSVQYMATHTLTGAVGMPKGPEGGPTKGQMEQEVVHEIIARVTKAFPGKLRGMIRQKLSNSAKTLKRKQMGNPNSHINEQ